MILPGRLQAELCLGRPTNIKTQTQNKVRFLLQLTLSLGVASRSQLAGKQQKFGVNNPHDICPLHAKVDALKCCYPV